MFVFTFAICSSLSKVDLNCFKFFSMIMSGSLGYLIVTVLLLVNTSSSNAFFLWTKLSPFSSSSPSEHMPAIHARPDYQYNWNIYQQSQTPAVLFPQLRQHHQTHHLQSQTSSSWLSALFKKPWLSWKWNKLGKRCFKTTEFFE